MWVDEVITPKEQLYYRAPFKAETGYRQGDIISPTILNNIVAAVIINKICKFNVENNEQKCYNSMLIMG